MINWNGEYDDKAHEFKEQAMNIKREYRHNYYKSLEAQKLLVSKHE